MGDVPPTMTWSMSQGTLDHTKQQLRVRMISRTQAPKRTHLSFVLDEMLSVGESTP